MGVLAPPPNNAVLNMPSGVPAPSWVRFFYDLYRRCKTIGDSGAAVLVGGTVTVSCSTVTAASRVLVSRSTAGGVPGHLSIVLTAGIGFVVNSSSGADTSTVNWQVVEP